MLFCVFLIPADVYSVSGDLNSDGTQAHNGTTEDAGNLIKWVYYGLYMAVVAFAFFILPFAYFYYENDDSDLPKGQRVCTAFKYAGAFMFVFAVLITVGILMKNKSSSTNEAWAHRLSEKFTSFDSIISFIIGCLSTIGLLSWITYTALGLALLPVKLMSSARADANNNKSDSSVSWAG